MQLKHLGNELDCMKGAVLGKLRQAELLQGLVVEPMARPGVCWTDEHFRQYAQHLRLGGPEQLAKHNLQWDAAKRTSYFVELDCYSGRDFFLDPDAGVATGRG